MPMLIARDFNNRVITVEAAERNEFAPPLRCEFCEAQVEFVRAYFRGQEDKDYAGSVQAHFRLRKGGSHASACPNDIRRRIRVLAGDTRKKYIEQQPDGSYVLRLLVSGSRQRLDAKASSTEQGPWRLSDAALSDYVNSAMGVAMLRADCVDSADIEGHLVLMLSKQSLSWKDFYFEPGSYLRCFHYVERTQGQYPVAIAGIVSENKMVPNENGEPLALLSLEVRPRLWASDRLRVLESLSISIWSRNPHEFGAYRAGDRVIALGFWRAVTVERPNTNRTKPVDLYLNHRLHLWPVLKSQLCVIPVNPSHGRFKHTG